MSRLVVLALVLVLPLWVGPPPAAAQVELSDIGLLWKGNGRVTTGTASGGVDVPVLHGWPDNGASVADVSADGSIILTATAVVATDDTGARALHFPSFDTIALGFLSASADRVVAGSDGHLSSYDLHELMTMETGFGLPRAEETVLAQTDTLVTRGWVSPDYRQLIFRDGALVKALDLANGQTTVLVDTTDYNYVDVSWSPNADRYALVLTDSFDQQTMAQIRTRDHVVLSDLSTPNRQVTDAAFNPSGTTLWLEWWVPTGQGFSWTTAGVANPDGSNIRRLGSGSDEQPHIGPSRAVWLDDDTLLVPDTTDDVLELWDTNAHAPRGVIGSLDPLAFQPLRRLPVRGPANLPSIEPEEIRDIAGRLFIDAPIDAAVSLSAARFADGAATHAVVGRHDVFADSLAGAALTADGPMLFTTSDGLVPSTAAELDRVLPDGSTVYVLGGPAALSDDVLEAIADLGLEPRRLSGAGRIETSVAVAREVLDRNGGSELYVARAGAPASNPTAAWADSASVGAASVATGIPVVVVGDTLHPAVADLIDDAGITATTVLGGTAAVPDDVLADLPSPRRLAGATRFATAVAIADDVFGLTAGTSGDMVMVNGEHRDGWALSFAAAGYAAGRDIPVVLTGSMGMPDEVRAALANCTGGYPVMLGDHTMIGRGVDTAHYEACRAE